ncbi:MAG TPA: helix-hairpin-helix domain-containing protein [Holophagaceae bacterium]|nr:helix-hairpin-helix domain-containing protein [Holophagaceae bacterium]
MSPKFLSTLTCGLAFALALPLAASGPALRAQAKTPDPLGPQVHRTRPVRVRTVPAPSVRPSHPAGHTPVARAKAPRAPQRPVDLNTATVTELMQLPKVGQRTAERIVAFRKEHGGFKRPEELMSVKGIGEKSFAKLKPYLLVAAPASR